MGADEQKQRRNSVKQKATSSINILRITIDVFVLAPFIEAVLVAGLLIILFMRTANFSLCQEDGFRAGYFVEVLLDWEDSGSSSCNWEVLLLPWVSYQV